MAGEGQVNGVMHIYVNCPIMEHEGLVLAAQRQSMKWAVDVWNFCKMCSSCTFSFAEGGF